MRIDTEGSLVINFQTGAIDMTGWVTSLEESSLDDFKVMITRRAIRRLADALPTLYEDTV